MKIEKLKASMKVSIQELTRKYGSKKDIYRQLTINGKPHFSMLIHSSFSIGKLFLPSMRHCTFDYLLQVIEGKKKAFTTDEVSKIQIRQFKELRMRNILEQVLPHPEVEAYLPPKTRETYRVDEW